MLHDSVKAAFGCLRCLALHCFSFDPREATAIKLRAAAQNAYEYARLCEKVCAACYAGGTRQAYAHAKRQ